LKSSENFRSSLILKVIKDVIVVFGSVFEGIISVVARFGIVVSAAEVDLLVSVLPLCPEKLPDASSVVKSIMSTVNNSELEVEPIELGEVKIELDDVITDVMDSRVDSCVDSWVDSDVDSDVDSCVVCCKVVVTG